MVLHLNTCVYYNNQNFFQLSYLNSLFSSDQTPAYSYTTHEYKFKYIKCIADKMKKNTLEHF